ncbi:hypothetical protein S245_056788, partial [Arachis hypogaea]
EEITQIKTSSSNETVGTKIEVRILGTPTEEQWPGVTLLRDWHTYPKWEPQNLARTVPTLGPDGVDLLT